MNSFPDSDRHSDRLCGSFRSEDDFRIETARLGKAAMPPKRLPEHSFEKSNWHRSFDDSSSENLDLTLSKLGLNWAKSFLKKNEESKALSISSNSDRRISFKCCRGLNFEDVGKNKKSSSSKENRKPWTWFVWDCLEVGKYWDCDAAASVAISNASICFLVKSYWKAIPAWVLCQKRKLNENLILNTMALVKWV